MGSAGIFSPGDSGYSLLLGLMLPALAMFKDFHDLLTES